LDSWSALITICCGAEGETATADRTNPNVRAQGRHINNVDLVLQAVLTSLERFGSVIKI